MQDVLQAQAAHAVNLSLTARNWLVGYYIVEYEQHGDLQLPSEDDIKQYLLENISEEKFKELKEGECSQRV